MDVAATLDTNLMAQPVAVLLRPSHLRPHRTANCLVEITLISAEQMMSATSRVVPGAAACTALRLLTAHATVWPLRRPQLRVLVLKTLAAITRINAQPLMSELSLDVTDVVATMGTPQFLANAIAKLPLPLLPQVLDQSQVDSQIVRRTLISVEPLMIVRFLDARDVAAFTATRRWTVPAAVLRLRRLPLHPPTAFNNVEPVHTSAQPRTTMPILSALVAAAIMDTALLLDRVTAR